MSTKLELETFAGATIQSWKDQATKAGLVLRAPVTDTESGDFPENVYSQLRRFRKVISRAKGEPKKVVTSMHRQLVETTSNPFDNESTFLVQIVEQHKEERVKVCPDLKDSDIIKR